MPQDIQQGRVTAALVEKYGIRGRFRPRLDEVIVPVHVVAQEEASAIQGTGYAVSFFEAALAGEGAVARFVGGVNFDTLPRFIVARPTAAATFLIRLNTSAVSTVLTGATNVAGVNRYNPRNPGAPTRMSFGTTAAGTTGDAVRRFDAPAAESVIVDLEGYRLTDTAVELNVICETLNTGVSWSAEYDVQPSDS